MSEAGWLAFLEAGLDDWVVLHGGATALFVTGSMADAARLAHAVAELPAVAESGALLTVAGTRLTVRLTRGVFKIEQATIDLARAISAIAHDHGVSADRAQVQEVQVTVAALPEAIDVGFWRAVLGYQDLSPDNGADPLGHGSTVVLQELNPAKPLRHAMHIDVSVAREHARARLDAALAAGGRIVDDSAAPGAWILADRAGNKVCIASWPDGARRDSANPTD